MLLHMFHLLPQKSKRRRSLKCESLTVFANSLPLVFPIPSTVHCTVYFYCVLDVGSDVIVRFCRAAIGEQKRLKSKKVLSDKKAFRRTRDSWD